MLKVLILQGLPGSGKTTYAKELQAKEPGKWKRVNKDDLRAMLDDGVWSRDNEKLILELRDHIVHQALRDGFNVIVDDTNFNTEHEKTISRKSGDLATVAIKLLDSPLDLCIERDAKREHPVGEKVIRAMYERYLLDKVVPDISPLKADAILCDVDGTLALCEDGREKAYYYDRDFSLDKVNTPIKEILLGLAKTTNYRIVIVSARKVKAEMATKKWLHVNGIPCDVIYMRRDDDNRPDNIVKEEMYRERIAPYYNVKFVLDDRDRVVKMWRGLGLTCLQVAEGEF